MMPITFTKHAQYQLRERNISPAAVRRCVTRPDKVILQHRNRFRAVKEVKKIRWSGLLVVVYEQRQDIVEVVTAFYTSKVEKYL